MAAQPTDWACTRQQRQYIEALTDKHKLRYAQVLAIASLLFRRTVTDVGQLSKGEASTLIGELNTEDL